MEQINRNSFRERFPTKSEWGLLFVASALIVNMWSIFNFLRWVPAFILRMKLSDLFTVFAYVQAFALIESGVILLILVIAGVFLPRRTFRRNWAAHGTVFLFVTGLFVMVYHYLPWILPVVIDFTGAVGRMFHLEILESQDVIIGGGLFFVIWLALYFVLLRWTFTRLRRRSAFAESIISFLNRAGVLVLLFIAVDLISCVWLLVRFPYG